MRPLLVLLAEDAGTLLAVKRAVEGGGNAEVVLVRSAEKLAARLDGLATAPAAVVMHWRLRDHGALRCAWELKQRPASPPVFVFEQAWAGDALRQALQLGAAAVLRTPITWDALHAELATLDAAGEARSRRELVRRAPDLLRADPELWRVGLTRGWRQRMIALAQRLRVARRAADEPLDAVRWVVEALPPLLRDERVDQDRLRALLEDGALPHHFAVDQDRLRALLADDAPQHGPPLTPGLLEPAVVDAVDHVRLLQLRDEFGPVLEVLRGIDVDALRAVLPPDAAWETGLEPEALMRLRVLAALLARSRGRPDIEEVLRTYHEGRGIEPHEAPVLDRLLHEAGLEEAREAMWRLLVGDGMSGDKVEKLLRLGKLDEALMGLNSLPDSLPNKPTLLNNAGLALRVKQRYPEAERCYRQALALRPGAPSLLFNLAVVVHDLGRDEEALRHVDAVLAKRPDLDAAQRLRADVVRRLGG